MNNKVVTLVAVALSTIIISPVWAQDSLKHPDHKPVLVKTKSAPAPSKVVNGVYYSAATQKADILRVETFLNSLTTMKADFIQNSPDKTSQKGKFYLARPGRLRWEYSPVPPVVIVARNGNVTYYDKELDQVSHVSTDDPLASILTRKNIKLNDADLNVVYINKPKGQIVLSVVRKNKPDEGRVTFTVKDPTLQLEAIEVVDAAGNKTDIQFSNIILGDKISDSLFSIQPKNDVLRNRPR